MQKKNFEILRNVFKDYMHCSCFIYSETFLYFFTVLWIWKWFSFLSTISEFFENCKIKNFKIKIDSLPPIHWIPQIFSSKNPMIGYKIEKKLLNQIKLKMFYVCFTVSGFRFIFTWTFAISTNILTRWLKMKIIVKFNAKKYIKNNCHKLNTEPSALFY